MRGIEPSSAIYAYFTAQLYVRPLRGPLFPSLLIFPFTDFLFKAPIWASILIQSSQIPFQQCQKAPLTNVKAFASPYPCHDPGNS